MGSRSNLFVITDRHELDSDNDLVIGLAMYSHWGGINAQLRALFAVDHYGLSRLDDKSYFTRIAARAFTAGDDCETGSGLTPMSMVVQRGAASPFATGDLFYNYITDNDGYNIPVLDLTSMEVLVYRPAWKRSQQPTLMASYPITEDGLMEAIRDIEGAQDEED